MISAYGWKFSFKGLHVLIQSEKEPSLLDSRVENFLHGVEVRFKNSVSYSYSVTLIPSITIY